MNKTIPLLFLIFLSFRLYSAAPEKAIDTFQIHTMITKMGVDESLLNFKNNFFKSIVFKDANTIYYNPEGTLMLFKIENNDSLVVLQLSKSIYHGHNFKRNLFTHGDTLFSYGGEGLFNVFPHLIFFDEKSSSWLKKEVRNYPLTARKVVNSWKTKDKITVLLNHYSNEQANSNFAFNHFSLGEINLITSEYKNLFDFTNEGDKELRINNGDFQYHSEKYDLMGFYNSNGTCRYQIFNKIKGELFQIPFLTTTPSINGINYLYIHDNQLFFRNNESYVDSIDLMKTEKLNVMNYFNFYRSKKNNNNKILYLIFISATFLILGLIIYIKNKKPFKSNNSYINIEKILNTYKGNNISKDELDKILNIAHYSYETIKTKRSVLIKEINQRKKVNIVRIRKIDDKRYFEYQIK